MKKICEHIESEHDDRNKLTDNKPLWYLSHISPLRVDNVAQRQG